jgi:hypothetical protein
MEGYKVWDPPSRRIVYNQHVVFIKVRGKSNPEVVQTKKNIEK